jgi:molybdopterin converting factor subunit 1
MRINVKLFAILRERAGVSELTLDLPEGATLATAREPLLARLPALRGQLARCAYAVNRSYAGADTTLQDGDEVALIPPVSGG